MCRTRWEVDDRKFSQPVLEEGANGNLKNDPCLRLVADRGEDLDSKKRSDEVLKSIY